MFHESSGNTKEKGKQLPLGGVLDRRTFLPDKPCNSGKAKLSSIAEKALTAKRWLLRVLYPAVEVLNPPLTSLLC